MLIVVFSQLGISNRLTTFVQLALHCVTTMFALVLAFARVTRQRTLGAQMRVAVGFPTAAFLLIFLAGLNAWNVANAQIAALVKQRPNCVWGVYFLQAATSDRRAVLRVKLLQ